MYVCMYVWTQAQAKTIGSLLPHSLKDRCQIIYFLTCLLTSVTNEFKASKPGLQCCQTAVWSVENDLKKPIIGNRKEQRLLKKQVADLDLQTNFLIIYFILYSRDGQTIAHRQDPVSWNYLFNCGATLAEVFCSMLQPPHIMAHLFRNSCREATSAWKSGYRACWGDRQQKQLPGTGFWNNWQRNMGAAVQNRKSPVPHRNQTGNFGTQQDTVWSLLYRKRKYWIWICRPPFVWLHGLPMPRMSTHATAKGMNVVCSCWTL